ncbi:MAG: alpha/beta hydrolase [Bacteroidota bacterium]
MNNSHSLVIVNGKQLYCEIINSHFRDEKKPVLVFLHEGLGSCKQWKDFPEILSKEVQCTALLYDRYGYGKSEALSEKRTPEFINEEAFVFLPELLAALNITEKVILIGHSDGGTISLLYASQNYKNLAGVIVEADHVICEEITFKGIRDAVNDYENGRLKELLSKYHLDKTDSMFHGWSDTWLSVEKKSWSIEKELIAITVPVLAIQGKDDNFGSVEQLTSKLKHIKGTTEVLFLKDCGHIPHLQAKDEVLSSMTRFINNIIKQNKN